ncbi:class 3 adenylate cyclase [Mumia flava]|uniref:Class 3 adenylate cyclase n=1 Tax=Mumia flava TaxID=1348852 RepID=A0A0B2BTV9_9ACTN|nr:adenylate/guanylate cyclase domain-containing protein [Mumia flava]PJJ57993.1 class 3 adenylate cyclase [Mumia flava]
MTGAPRPERSGPGAGRVALLAIVLALPMLGLAVLLWQPDLDVWWEDHRAHFWLVLATGVLSAVLAYATGVAALRRADARVLLVSYAFLSVALFLGLHALATPGILLDTPNAGFVLATPVGLALGSVFALASSGDLTGERDRTALRWAQAMRWGIIGFAVLWAAASLMRIPPLREQGVAEEVDGLLTAFAGAAIVLYGVSAYRYLRLWARHRSLMLLSMASAFVLLAESCVSVVLGVSWHLSWWEWHVLMLAAFVLVALGARIQWHEERFADLYLEDTTAGNREMSVLFADLKGFTTFSEQHTARDVTAMLNAYFEVAVPPVVRRYRGEVDRIIGDALMVTFNRRGDQPDHARRAVLAGLALQEATATVADAHPGWPRFRVGVNSGEVTVSVLGTEGGRTQTVIGDTVNTASRIEGKAPVGGVAVGPSTLAALPDADAHSLGHVELKGKAEPLEVFEIRGLGS